VISQEKCKQDIPNLFLGFVFFQVEKKYFLPIEAPFLQENFLLVVFVKKAHNFKTYPKSLHKLFPHTFLERKNEMQNPLLALLEK
jgi:hypothetical protein